MKRTRWTLVVVWAALLMPLGTGVRTDQGRARGAGVPQQADTTVPSDLKSLLVARPSEMRLVSQRYNADRATLAQNFLSAGGDAGGLGGGGGRAGGAGAPASGAVSLSPNRVARLKRFDTSWREALSSLDAARFSESGRADLVSLKTLIDDNLRQLDLDAEAVFSLSPLVPFAPRIVTLVEARIRMANMDAEHAAGEISAVTKEVAAVRARLEAGLAGGPATGDTLRVPGDLARRTAAAVEGLRSNVTGWFNHYNGYDPLFTWWMGLPYKRVDEALTGYAAFLREKVAPADLPAAGLPAGPAPVIAASAAPRLPEVPDLRELTSLPHDEMAAVVDRFFGRTAGGGRGGRGGGQVARDPQYYRDWLTALRTLDFDALSRNGQVDYLYIKKISEMQLARAGISLPANPPRKTDDSGITGAARGREGLIRDLQDELIPYTPEQLIALGDREFEWCLEEMKKASRQMGFGDDWKAALEKVKTMHVAPGRQPELVRDLLFYAVDYLRENDLITVPQVAGESLRMRMLSPQEQLTAPFFLGGAMILVAYPTDTMDYDARIQAMRGNNIPFSNAVAHHEMIPGHNLVGYMSQRYAGYRANLGSTPFFGEGWPLYWETLLYDLGFHDTPEKRIGALFWRMHRSARITFSLRFHMGQWSPQECIDFLVDRVGHERDNATAEVRRSFAGNYGPLYQAAYLLGGLQIRGLRRELVESKQMTSKAFHDEIMRQGGMPIALLRLALTRQRLTRDMSIDWQFYGRVD